MQHELTCTRALELWGIVAVHKVKLHLTIEFPQRHDRSGQAF